MFLLSILMLQLPLKLLMNVSVSLRLSSGSNLELCVAICRSARYFLVFCHHPKHCLSQDGEIKPFHAPWCPVSHLTQVCWPLTSWPLCPLAWRMLTHWHTIVLMCRLLHIPMSTQTCTYFNTSVQLNIILEGNFLNRVFSFHMRHISSQRYWALWTKSFYRL